MTTMKFDGEIGLEIVARLAKHKQLNPLPRGNVWSKYGKDRIYFNEKTEDMDYTFYLDFSKDEVEVADLVEEYWLPRLDPMTLDELQHIVELIYYEVAYPLDEKMPVNTIREMRQHKRFEGCIHQKNKETVKFNLAPLDLEIVLPLEHLEVIRKTPRTKGKNVIHRFVMRDEYVDAIIKEFERKEDEADALFMQQLQSSVPQKISITQHPDEKKDSEIYIDEGEVKNCLNCHKEFNSYADDPTDFCSNECKVEYQQESW